MNQTARDIMLYDAQKKSSGVAYLWWFLLGFLGAHRFYLKRPGSAIAQAVANIGGSWLAFADGIKPVHTFVIGGGSYAIYTGLTALIFNVVVAVVVQLLLGKRGEETPALRQSAG